MLTKDGKEVPSIFQLEVPGGYLEVAISCDSLYPGVDVEFHSDKMDQELDEGKRVSYPRVNVEMDVEKPEVLTVRIWNEPTLEDYSTRTDIDTTGMSEDPSL